MMFDNSNKYLQFIGGFLALGFTLLQGIDWVFRKFEIDSFYFNLILIILFVFLLAGIISFLIKANKEKLSSQGPKKRSIVKLTLNISLTIILIFVFFKPCLGLLSLNFSLLYQVKIRKFLIPCL